MRHSKEEYVWIIMFNLTTDLGIASISHFTDCCDGFLLFPHHPTLLGLSGYGTLAKQHWNPYKSKWGKRP